MEPTMLLEYMLLSEERGKFEGCIAGKQRYPYLVAYSVMVQ